MSMAQVVHMLIERAWVAPLIPITWFVLKLTRTAARIRRAVSGGNTPDQSVKTITREDGRKRKLSNRLTSDQVQELVAAFQAGTTRIELAKQYGIGRTSVAKLLGEWRDRRDPPRAPLNALA